MVVEAAGHAVKGMTRSGAVAASSQPQAGPSNHHGHHDRHVTQYAEIPSYGPQFFEYRRRLFLADLPLPEPHRSESTTSAGLSLPSSYRIALPLPDPLPSAPNAPGPSTSAGRLEAMLEEEGAEETLAVWNGGLEKVHEKLTSGRRLLRPLRLGLVIKVLKAGWIKDGTWPVDPETSRAARPPDSPFLGPIPPLRTTSMIPDLHDENDDQIEARIASTSAVTSQGPALLAALDEDAQREKEMDEMVDEARDVRIGGDLWRGAGDTVTVHADGIPTIREA